MQNKDKMMYINPLTPKSDWDLISHYSITVASNVKVMRIWEMIAN